MAETVRLGDSFSSLAERMLGDGSRWQEVEQANRLPEPGLLLLDQQIRAPSTTAQDASLTVVGKAPSVGLLQTRPSGAGSGPAQRSSNARETRPALVPAHSYVFVVADEVNPLNGKVIRRVITSPKLADEVAKRIGKPVQVFPNPERFGFSASDPNSALPLGRHAQGMKPSPFQSASRTQPLGARRFAGDPFWIDEAKARAAGATFHEAPEVVSDLRRILAKTKNPAGRAQLEGIIKIVHEDREVLLKGAVPAAAVKGVGAMSATRALQGVEIIGFVMSAVSLEHATERSFDQHSVRPLAAETVRQAGGWAAAWAGMKLGALGGAAVGIESGPGAVVTAAAGGIVGGVIGYFGFGWIADHIEKH